MVGRVRRYLVSSGAPFNLVTAKYICRLLNPYLETPKSRVLGIQYKCDTSMYPSAQIPHAHTHHSIRQHCLARFQLHLNISA